MKLTCAGYAATAVSSGSALLSVPRTPEALAALGGADFPRALVGLATLACAGLSLWLLLIVAGEWAHVRLPGVPKTLRALLFSSITVAAVSAATATAYADDIDGLRLPDRPEVTAAATASGQPISLANAGDVSVTVTDGDSIWRLAAEQLPVSATTEQIARSAANWHRVNRAVIGPDPNLILPGQQLVLPTSLEKQAP